MMYIAEKEKKCPINPKHELKVVTSDEGTSHCKNCEKTDRETDKKTKICDS